MWTSASVCSQYFNQQWLYYRKGWRDNCSLYIGSPNIFISSHCFILLWWSCVLTKNSQMSIARPLGIQPTHWCRQPCNPGGRRREPKAQQPTKWIINTWEIQIWAHRGGWITKGARWGRAPNSPTGKNGCTTTVVSSIRRDSLVSRQT